MSKRFPQILSSSFVLITLVAVFILMLVIELNQWQKKRNIDKEIAKLTTQSNDLEQKNQEISSSLSFLNSTSFKEKIAREQLNLKKDGEQVYDVPDSMISAQSAAEAASTDESKMSNLHKWYVYFFK